jgi:ribose/xylose/arabinose/galactoside ABC-type transport system permease subunit
MKQTTNVKTIFARIIQSYGLIVMVIIMIAIFAVLNENFFTLSNLLNILEQNAALAIVAVGITFSIISTAMDLSPASVIALTGVVIAIVFRDTGSIAAAVLAGILLPMLIGLFNGLLIARMNINPVIVTLAAFIWARGLALALTEKSSVVIQSPMISFMNTRFLGVISPPVVLIALCYLLGILLLNKTRLGRYTFAMGGKEQAARQAGVPVDRYKIGIFLLGGFFVGVSAIITVSRMGAAQPNAVYGLELDAIAAVIIGGTSLSGGEGSLRQTIIGVIFLALLNNGLSTLGLRDASFYFYKGLVVLLALFIEVTSHRLLKDSKITTA